MNRQSGLTLVEILVAIVILAVGVIGAMLMQTSGLRATRTSQVMQDLNADARSQLDLTRLMLASGTWSGGTSGCDIRGSSDCLVEVEPCRVLALTLDCQAGAVAEPAAWAVTVTVNRGDSQLVLSSVVYRSGD